MHLLVYLLTYPILWLIANLPTPVLYRVSDLAFFLVYHLFGYRKKVVLDNLKLVFPEKEEAELLRIRRKFYRHMCDMFLEMARTMGISRSELKRRYVFKNLELIDKAGEGRSVMILLSHYGNWEWSAVINSHIKLQSVAMYQRINNPYFDKLVRRIRERWNAETIHQREAVRSIVRNEAAGRHCLYGVLSDQSPQKHRAKYWRSFLGPVVPIFDGPEALARKHGMAVFFGKVTKHSRGKYELDFIPIAEDASETSEHFITDRYLDLVEEQIRENPAYYLWTHRRWKHRR